jgi:hypothetical protein
MKKFFFSLILGAAIFVSPSCKKDDDKNGGGGNTTPTTLVGEWTFSEYSFNGAFDIDFMGVPAQLEIDGQKVSGTGTLRFLTDNTVTASGVIGIESTTVAKAFGQVIFSDTETENEDLSEMFEGSTYELLPGSKVRMIIDDEEVILDYVFGTNSVTLTGIAEFDNDLGDDPVQMNIRIKLTK